MYKPKVMYQTDKRWAGKKYANPGESATIGGSGCGPTCAAMIIATLADPGITPVDTCKWAQKHGYKATGAGTYHTYFVPQLKKYGITARKLETYVYHKKNAKTHDTALAHLKKGGWLIANMGPGRWTRGGHFILAYGYENGYVYINDPASTQANRRKAKWSTFKYQVKYYWLVDVPEQKSEPVKKPAKKVTDLNLTYYVDSPNDGYLNVRNKNGMSGKIVDKLKHGDKIIVIAQTKNWSKIAAGKWVCTKSLSRSKPVRVKYKALYNMNLRAGYTTRSKVKGSMKKGKTFTVTKERNGWGYIPAKKAWICLTGKKKYCKKV